MRRHKRRYRAAAMRLAVAMAAMVALGGCEDAEEFREVAGDSLKTGLNAIADGVIDGLFAVFEPDTTDS